MFNYLMDHFSEFVLYFFSFNTSVLNIPVFTILFLEWLLDKWPVGIVVTYTKLKK